MLKQALYYAAGERSGNDRFQCFGGLRMPHFVQQRHHGIGWSIDRGSIDSCYVINIKSKHGEILRCI